MAARTRYKLLGSPRPDITKPFRFRDLPKELQVHILRLTGLVAPHHVWYDASYNRWSLELLPCLYDVDVASVEEIPIGCCCLATWHSRSKELCRHWHFPGALFKVDRQMERDARAIMFRDNVWFEDWWSLHSNLVGGHTSQKALNTALFLANVRELSIRFSYIPSYNMPDLRYKWPQAVDSLLRNATLDRLSLVLRLPHPEHPHRQLSSDSKAPMWKAHVKTVQYFAKALDGRSLRHFFVSIQRHHIVEYPDDPHTDEPCPLPAPEGDIERLEHWLEQQVVGSVSDTTKRVKTEKVHDTISWITGADFTMSTNV
jgi:hypothetical protein